MPASERISRRSCVLVLVAALVAAQSAVFFCGRTLLPIAPSVTTTAGVPYGYSGPASYGPSAIDPAGSLNASYAFDLYTLAAIKEGTLPFWNPYQGLGQPMLGNGLSAVLYPLNALLLVVPRTWWDVVYLLNWLLAAYFVTEYLRVIGCRREGIVVGGVAVIGSGFFQYYLAMREVVAVAAWFPLLLYALERTAREPGWRHRHLVLALAVACSLTAGQPESSFIALAFAAAYGLVTMAALGDTRWRFAAECAPGAVAGLLLSAPFWLTFSDYAFKAFSNHPAGSHMSTIALDWRTAGAYLFPQLFGRIQTVPFATPVPGWIWDYSPGWMTVAAGLLAFAGLTAAIRERRRVLVLNAAMGLLILAKTWAVPGATLLAMLPLFDRVVYPRYASFVAAICAAVLAGVGFDRLYAMERRAAARLTVVWLAILFALYACTRVWTLPIFASREVQLYSLLGLAWALVVPLGLLWMKHCGREQYLAVAAGAAIVLQLIAFVPGYTPADYLGIAAATLGAWTLGVAALGSGRAPLSPAVAASLALGVITLIGIAVPRFAAAGLPRRYDVMTPPPYLEQLRRLQRLGGRVYALDGNPQPNFGAAFRLPSLNTLDVLAPAETAAFLNAYIDRSADPLWLSGTTGGRRGPATPLSELADNRRYFDFAGVRFLTSSRSTPARAEYDTAREVSSGPSPRPLVSPLESWFSAPAESWDLIEVLFSTYGQRNPGTARLTLLDADRQPLGESTIPAEIVRDNSYAAFTFTNVRLRVGQRVGIRVSFEPSAIGPMLAVWEYPPEAPATFAFRIPSQRSRVRQVFTDERTGVVIWERLDAFPRAFLAPHALVEPDPRAALGMIARMPDLRRQVVIDSGPAMDGAGSDGKDAGELIDLRTWPNRVRITYRAGSSGILTLTDSYAPGWRATINGSAAEIHRVNGAFRGVRIAAPGDYVVEYTYRPPTWRLSCAVAAAGLVLLVAVAARRPAAWIRA